MHHTTDRFERDRMTSPVVTLTLIDRTADHAASSFILGDDCLSELAAIVPMLAPGTVVLLALLSEPFNGPRWRFKVPAAVAATATPKPARRAARAPRIA